MSNHLLFSCALKYAARLCIFTLSSTMVPYSAFFIFFHLFSSFFQFFSCSIVYLIRFFLAPYFLAPVFLSAEVSQDLL